MGGQLKIRLFIMEELDKMGRYPTKLEYIKGKMVIAHTGDEKFLFSFNEGVRLVTKL